MDYSSHKRPLLLERAGVRRIKPTGLSPLIPAFSLKGEGAKLLNLMAVMLYMGNLFFEAAKSAL